MIKILSVRMKNFLITGNIEQSIVLSGTGMSQIIGENLDIGGENSRNGVGKSTILQAVCFGLFGQPVSNIKLDNLVNSVNGKNMYVVVDFEVNGKKYRIERGRKPAILKFFVEDAELDSVTDDAQGDNRRTQDEIDKVLQMSLPIFRHIVTMSTFVDPFLKQKPADQRNIIEELLGITQLSAKGELLKEQIKDTKNLVKEEQFKIKANIDANSNIQRTIDSLVSSSQKWEKVKENNIVGIGEKIIELDSVDIEKEIANHELLKNYTLLSSEIRKVKSDIRLIEKNLNKLLPNLDRYENQLTQTNENKCHACGNEVNKETHEEHLKIIKESIEQVKVDLEKEAVEMSEKELYLRELESAFSAFKSEPTVFYTTLQEAYDHKTVIDVLMNELKREESSSNPYLSQIETLKKEGMVEVSYDKLHEYEERLKHEEFLSKLLTSKDSFIRKRIIDSNINSLNHRLSHYLDKLRLPYHVEFKNDLSVDISLLGRDYDFEQLSRGEMNRVIISMSWAFRDIWENLNSPINLLMIDEMLDSGIDGQGVEAAVEILDMMVNERKKDVFLISHKEELMGRVNNIIKVTKQNSFASFTQ